MPDIENILARILARGNAIQKWSGVKVITVALAVALLPCLASKIVTNLVLAELDSGSTAHKIISVIAEIFIWAGFVAAAALLLFWQDAKVSPGAMAEFERSKHLDMGNPSEWLARQHLGAQVEVIKRRDLPEHPTLVRVGETFLVHGKHGTPWRFVIASRAIPIVAFIAAITFLNIGNRWLGIPLVAFAALTSLPLFRSFVLYRLAPRLFRTSFVAEFKPYEFVIHRANRCYFLKLPLSVSDTVSFGVRDHERARQRVRDDTDAATWIQTGRLVMDVNDGRQIDLADIAWQNTAEDFAAKLNAAAQLAEEHRIKLARKGELAAAPTSDSAAKNSPVSESLDLLE